MRSPMILICYFLLLLLGLHFGAVSMGIYDTCKIKEPRQRSYLSVMLVVRTLFPLTWVFSNTRPLCKHGSGVFHRLGEVCNW